MSETSKPELKTYRGNCHCGSFIYEATIPVIKAVYSCNCSLCVKKSHLLAAVPDEAGFKIVKGDENDLSVYQFGPKTRAHHFCPTCGSALFGRAPSAPVGKTMLLNVRCIQDLNIWEIPAVKFPGRDLGQPYNTPEYKGPEPTFDAETSKTYHGSCHCGAVTVAVKTHLLDEKYPETVKECNCSICQRNGYIWIYPKPEQVVIQGKENLINYAMGQKIMVKPFCRTCGIPISNFVNDGLSEDEIAALSPEARMWHGKASECTPINLRIINGLDIDSLNIEKIDGFNLIKPGYVNP